MPEPANHQPDQSPKESQSLSDLLGFSLRDIALEQTLGKSDPNGAVQIEVPEQNVVLRYLPKESPPAEVSQGTLPATLELELCSHFGSLIDTISFSKLTPESLRAILELALDRNLELPFSGLKAFEEPILPPGKLKELLQTAGSLGVRFETKLGVLPEDVANRYSLSMSRPPEQQSPEERYLQHYDRVVTYALIGHGFRLAQEVHISKVLVHAESPSTVREVNLARGNLGVIWILNQESSVNATTRPHDMVYTSQNSTLGKDAEVRLALFSALLQGQLALDQRVLMFSGPNGSRHLDRISLTVPGREFSWLTPESLQALKSISNSIVLEKLINLATRFAAEGIEGKKFGATFIIGDPEELAPHLNEKKRINPLAGHPEGARSIFDDGFTESLRTLASTDLAVIVRPDGVAEKAWVYLEAPTADLEPLDGWGARHISAAAVTAAKPAIAVVISQTGGVTVMWGGKALLRLRPG